MYLTLIAIMLADNIIVTFPYPCLFHVWWHHAHLVGNNTSLCNWPHYGLWINWNFVMICMY